MSWLQRLSQLDPMPALQAPSSPSPAMGIEEIVLQTVNGNISIEQASAQLAGNPESCGVINSLYQTNIPNNQILAQLARAIRCDLVGAGDVQPDMEMMGNQSRSDMNMEGEQ
jgi:hypothetical protein